MSLGSTVLKWQNHWATGGLHVNLTSLKGGPIIFPLFLLKGNAILAMTRKGGGKKNIESVIIIIPRRSHPPPSFFRTVIAFGYFLHSFRINLVISYILKQILGMLWVKF